MTAVGGCIVGPYHFWLVRNNPRATATEVAPRPLSSLLYFSPGTIPDFRVMCSGLNNSTGKCMSARQFKPASESVMPEIYLGEPSPA